MRRDLCQAFTAGGFEPVPCATAREAEEALAAGAADAIVLDVLPDGDGLERIARWRSDPRTAAVPVLLLSAGEGDAERHALEAGADAFARHDEEPEVVWARVAALLRRRQREHEVRRARAETYERELERRKRELEAFSYAVSHDLRAPLRAIDGFSRLLADEHGAALPAAATGYLGRVRGAARRMGELIDDLLELSRVGRAELTRRPVDLSALARAVGADLAARTPERAVELAVADTPPASADERLMRLALEHLLGNAWKFGAKTTAPRVAFSGVVVDGVPRYAVADNGAGFEMKYAARLFQPFQRLHGAAEFPGRGMGLATVHRIVDRHGGRVWAESEPGRGATFHFTLPQEPGK